MTQKIISREELSKLIGMGDSSLRKYISRGKIIEVEKGLIDINNEINKECIINYASKKGIDYKSIYSTRSDLTTPKTDEIIIVEPLKKKNKISKEKQKRDIIDSESNIPESDNPELEDMDYYELREEKLLKEVQKLEVETRLKNLELDKKKSKIIPIEFSIEMTQRYLVGTCGGIVNSGNSLIEDICDELNADLEQKLKYKKQLKALVSDTIKSKHEPVSNEIINYAKEYSLLLKW